MQVIEQYLLLGTEANEREKKSYLSFFDWI